MGCGPGASVFIEEHFKDCVYNVRDYVGFCLGLCAIVFWIIAQLPQYYRNYKTKSAEALSPWFLAQWLLGDTFNLIGALLQGQQLPTTVYTAMYFVVADMFMMMQYIYYGALQRRREKVLKLQARRRHHHHHHHHHHRRQQPPSLLPQHGGGDHTMRGGSSSPDPGQPRSGGAPGDDGLWHRQQPHHQQPPQQTQPQPQQQQQQHSDTWHEDHQHAQLQRSSSLCHAESTDDLLWQHGSSPCRQQQLPLGPGASAPPCTNSSNSTGSRRSSSGDETTCLQCSSIAAAGRHEEAVAVGPLPPASCAATAVAAGAVPWRLPRLPHGGMHLGSSRSVVAVGILVSLGLVSLLVPASTTYGMQHTVRLVGGIGAPVQQQQQQQQQEAGGGAGSLAARAMQAGVGPAQEGRHGMHSGRAGAPDAASSAAVAAPSNSSSSSSSSWWARRDRASRIGGGGDDPPEPRGWAFFVGTGLGYVSSVLYLCSRVSQILKNYARHSSEGLALVMFMMAVCANLCTGTSIMLRTFTWTELREQLPWIIGSLGTITLDMVILWQSTAYGKGGEAQQQQQQPGAAAAAADGGEGRAGLGGRQHHVHPRHPERQHLLHQQHPTGDQVVHGAAVPDGDGASSPSPGRSSLLGRRHVAAGAAGDLGEAVPLLRPAAAAAAPSPR